MTISSTTVKNSYAGNGTLDTFNYTFKIFANTDLQVIIRDATATETVKTLTTHYTVTGAGSASGGTIVFTAGNIPTATETVVIRRAVPQTQAIDYIANDPFPAESHEEGLDRAMMTLQQLQEEVDRSIKLSRTNTMNSTEFTIGDTNRANKVFGFDSAGELVVTQELGTFRGNWSASTSYAVRDIIKDTSNGNIYICLTAHTSSGTQPISTNTDSAKWSLIVDAETATSSATAAAASAAAAASSATAAQTAQTAAELAETNAETAETNAETAETNAATSETNAAASATSASNSATAAASSATSASSSAATATTQAGIATTQATNASTSATNAATSETNAASSASAASTSASNASTSETNAASSASAASTSATNASNSASAAATSATSSASSATAAANSAAAAEATFDLFDDSYLGAKSSNPTLDNDGNALQDGALYFDTTNDVMKVYDLGSTTWIQLTPTVANQNNINTVAGISAEVTAVANDAADIGTVATNINGIDSIGTVATDIANVNLVGGSITNVNEVADNIGTVNEFGERYRVSSTAPTTSLDVGDLYYDTTTDTMKVYGTSGWQNAGSSVNGTSQRYNYTATSGQTTFTGVDNNGNTLAYDAGYIDVYLNGVKLLNGTDVTVTSGSSVVLATGATTGDVIDIVAYGTFSVASLNADNLDSGTVPTARISGAYTGITQTGTLSSFASTGIDDNATSTAITIDSSENVGVGTSSPSLALDVRSTSVNTIRLSRDGTAGSGGNASLLFEGREPTLGTGKTEAIYGGTGSLSFFTGGTSGNLSGGSERMRIDASGNLLVGTTTQVGPNATGGLFNPTLSIKGATRDGLIELISSRSDSADAGVSRLQSVFSNNNASHQLIAEIQTETEGTTANQRGGRIKFNTKADGSTGVTERMRIDSSGRVGIGTTGAQRKLQIDNGFIGVSENGANSSTNQYNEFTDNSSNWYNTKFYNFASSPASHYMIEVSFASSSPDNSSAKYFDMRDTTTSRVNINSDGDIYNHDGTYGTISDERIKQNIVDAGSQWEDIKNIRVRKYKKKHDVIQYGEENAPTEIGVISQELETVSPGLIKEDKADKSHAELHEDFAGDNPQNVKYVKYSILYMKAIKALQEAMERIETLEAKVQTLENNQP